VIAEARAPVAIEADKAPSVTLEARRIIVTAGRAFEVTCTTRNVGPGATYRWKIGHDSVSTDAAVVSHTIALAGDHEIEVAVLSAEGKFLAGDKATLSVEAGEDLVWIEDVDIRDGQRVVLRKYQVFRGTHTRHGLYLDWHTTQEEGQLEVRKTFDHDVCIKSETFYEDGAPRALEHFDKDGRRHGECAYYLADGRRTMLVSYVHGKKSGPYEKTIYSTTTFTRTSGRYTNDLAEGRWSVHTGNWKTGKEYLKSTTEMSGGQRNGLHVSYLPDGRKSAESHYRNDKRHGVARSWYTWEVDDGIYYKMNERDYEDGKLIRERKYRSNGELLWEKQR
jgi:antitoxin component YwqK of YwqJK toxin-antitoxin module